jgi:proton-coupled amino acid transporter
MTTPSQRWLPPVGEQARTRLFLPDRLRRQHEQSSRGLSRDIESLEETVRPLPSLQLSYMIGCELSVAELVSSCVCLGIEGTATATDAVFMLLKGFIGTGGASILSHLSHPTSTDFSCRYAPLLVLFMGRAFLNGGILFSALVLLFVGAISLWAFLLLVKTRLVVPGSFGDIGGTLYGPWLRTTILSSIALSQIGFVAAYVIFIASNMQDFIKAVTASSKIIDIKYLIVGQLVVFLPLSFIRSIAKLSGTALIADAFILIGRA